MSDTTSIEWATATQRRRPGRVASGFDQRAHPTSSSTDWRRVAARMRAELDRAASASVSFHTADGKREWNPVKLAGRPKELAELVVKATLARGRWQVVIPELAKFGEQVGIRDTHIRGVFHVLECARIVELERGERGWTLTVFPHSPEWLGVTWRYEEKSLLDYLAALDRAPGQVQAELFDAGEVETTAAPAFTRARAESATEQASSSRNGNQFPKREPEPVPKTGTPSLRLGEASRLQALSSLSLEGFKDLKLQVESGDEREACTGMKQVLGPVVWEGGIPGREIGDGGKWRMRWRANRHKVQRVFLDMIEEAQLGRHPQKPGGRAEMLWKEFF